MNSPKEREDKWGGVRNSFTNGFENGVLDVVTSQLFEKQVCKFLSVACRAISAFAEPSCIFLLLDWFQEPVERA